EGAHGFRCDHLDHGTVGPWGVDGGGQGGGVGACHGVAVAALDGETLGQGGDLLLTGGDAGADHHDAAHGGIGDRIGGGSGAQCRLSVGDGRQLGGELDVVLEVHQGEHALNHGSGIGARDHGGADRGEHSGPGATDQHIGSGGCRGHGGRQVRGGDIVVVGQVTGVQGGLPLGDTIGEGGQGAAGGDTGEFIHGRFGISLGDLRNRTRDDVPGQGETDDQVGGGA